MLENRTSYYHTFNVDAAYPYSIEVPEIITRIGREITRNATLLIRLIKLLLEDGASISDSDYIIKRITIKLGNQLEIWDAHCKADLEEYNSISAELEKAIIEREALQIKRRLNDICEEEYSLKLSVAYWSIEDLRAKSIELENCLKAWKSLKGLLVLGDIEDLYQMSKYNYYSLYSLWLEPETLKIVTQTLSKILNSITHTGPSTL